MVRTSDSWQYIDKSSGTPTGILCLLCFFVLSLALLPLPASANVKWVEISSGQSVTLHLKSNASKSANQIVLQLKGQSTDNAFVSYFELVGSNLRYFTDGGKLSKGGGDVSNFKTIAFMGTGNKRIRIDTPGIPSSQEESNVTGIAYDDSFYQEEKADSGGSTSALGLTIDLVFCLAMGAVLVSVCLCIWLASRLQAVKKELKQSLAALETRQSHLQTSLAIQPVDSRLSESLEALQNQVTTLDIKLASGNDVNKRTADALDARMDRLENTTTPSREEIEQLASRLKQIEEASHQEPSKARGEMDLPRALEENQQRVMAEIARVKSMLLAKYQQDINEIRSKNEATLTQMINSKHSLQELLNELESRGKQVLKEIESSRTGIYSTFSAETATFDEHVKSKIEEIDSYIDSYIDR